MTARGTAVADPVGARSPGRAVSGLAVRLVRRGALVLGLAVAGMSALVVAGYAGTLSDPADVAALTALAGNPAIATLFGEPVALDDPGGFAVWRTGQVVGVLGGVWGLLAATRITRGQEDDGRWDLLLAGRVPLRSVVARHLAVLVLALCATGAATAAAMVTAGTAVTGALLHGAGVAATGIFFAAAGTLATQVFPGRGAATGAAVALLARAWPCGWSVTGSTRSTGCAGCRRSASPRWSARSTPTGCCRWWCWRPPPRRSRWPPWPSPPAVTCAAGGSPRPPGAAPTSRCSVPSPRSRCGGCWGRWPAGSSGSAPTTC